jgi:hypothetical protein
MTGELPIKVEVRVGKRAVEKLVDAVLDAFSPGTETLGLLGDAVRLARVEVAATVTQHAKEIADANGLKLTVPPLKFLVPFFEKASTEDKDDATLMEMWAQLLASAGANYNANQLRYTSLLAEMSPTQATILDGIARNFEGVLGEGRVFDPDRLFYSLVESRLISDLKRIDETDPDQLLDAIMNEIAFPGVSVVLVQCEMRADGTTFDWTGDTVYRDTLSIDFEILRSMGLLAKVETEFIDLKHAAITVILYHVTELGLDFWRACSGRLLATPATDGQETSSLSA